MTGLATLLSPERVSLQESFGSKKRLLEFLSEQLATTASGPGVNTIFSCLLERERLGSTGLGHGVALPHGRLESLAQPRAAFLKLQQGLVYDGAADDQPVDLVLALLFPEDGRDEHLQILALVAKMFSDEAFCERLRAATSEEALFRLLVDWSADDAGVTGL